MKDSFLAQLESITGSAQVLQDQDPPVFCPPTVESAAELVRRCDAAGWGIAVQGGGTFPLIAGDPSLVWISTGSLAGVTEINRDDYLMVVKAGEIVDDMVARAEENRLYLPIDLPSGDRATIGGTYMSGAFVSGTASDGSLRKMIIGVKAISAKGDVVTFGGRTVKNVTGFEVTRFLAGTMGLYAIVVELIVKAQPVPEYRTVLTVTAEPGKAPDLLNLLENGLTKAARVVLMAPEGIEGGVTLDVHFEGFRPIINKAMGTIADFAEGMSGISIAEGAVSDFRNRYRALARKMFSPELYAVTMPPQAVQNLLEGLPRIAPDALVIGHTGYGRFYLSGIEGETVQKLENHARVLGGCAPVKFGHIREHGIGSLFAEPERMLARSLKRELDPRGILNPHIQF